MFENTIDSFLKDRSEEKAGGGGGKYLKWRENKRVRVWLHAEKPMTKLWRHGAVPRLVTVTDKETDEQVTKMWPGFWNCLEAEDVLKKQYKRDRYTGERDVYPKKCPLCRLVETVHQMVEAGQLPWTKQIFRFETDDPNASVSKIVIHAGGIIGAFQRTEIDERHESEMKKAGISPMKAWTENGASKAAYLFCVVDHDSPEKGVQIAIESKSLGDKVLDVIQDARDSLGNEDGDPRLHPYAIGWKYNREAKAFGDKYHALRLEKLEATDEILDAIRGELPDLERDTQPFNIINMRGLLEKHALVKLPWDEIFDVPAAKSRGEAESKEPAAKSKQKPAAKPVPKAAKSVPAINDDDKVECDSCGKPMLETAAECPHCGETYGVDVADKAAPPPPPKQAVPAKGSKKIAPPPPPSESLFGDSDSDDIGF